MLPSLSRFTRLLTATVAALAALAAAAGSALAADEPPKCGSKLCLQTTHDPSPDRVLPEDVIDFVTPEGYLRYRVDVTTPKGVTSTATKVTFKFELDKRLRLLESSVPAGCPKPAPSAPPPPLITCFFGSVKPIPEGSPRRFEFLVQVPKDETQVENGKYKDPITSTASISSDARSSDSGNNPNDPTVEAFSDHAEVVGVDLVNGLSASFIPQSAPDDEPLRLDTDPNGVGPTGVNPQSAVFRLLAFNFSTAAVIQDEVQDPPFVCPPKLKCPSAGWVRASVPGPPGLIDPFGSPNLMEITIHYDASAFLDGITENGYVMFHLKDTGVLERITRPCSKNPAPCLVDVDLDQNGDLTAIALGTENSRYR